MVNSVVHQPPEIVEIPLRDEYSESALRETALLCCEQLRQGARILLIKNFWNSRAYRGGYSTGYVDAGSGDEELRARLLWFCRAIGHPTATDVVERQVIWEVTPRKNVTVNHSPTITEHNEKAELHTDSSYKTEPEDLVVFLMVRSAKRGGESYFVSGEQIVEMMSKSEKDKLFLTLLQRTPVPFRVPTSFTKERRDDVPEWVLAPVLSDQRIRFRYDSIIEGLDCAKEIAEAEVKPAIVRFRELAEALRPTRYQLNNGELIVIDNRFTLHGRTAFEESTRLMLRVRLRKNGTPATT